MKKIFLLTVLPLAACSGFMGTANLNVQQIGKDSYTVRALSSESASAAKQLALSAANAFCAQQKRNVQLVKEYAGTEETGGKFDDVTFLCVPAGDPDFKRVGHDTFEPAKVTE